MKRTLVSAVAAAVAKYPPPVAHGAWRGVECPACTVVTGLSGVLQVVELPADVGPITLSSPVVPLGEAVEVFSRIAPKTAESGILQPILAAIMEANDHGKPGRAFTCFWLLVESMETLDGLRLKPGQSEPISPFDYRDMLTMSFGNTVILPTHRMQHIVTRQLTAADLTYREEQPVPWIPGHALADLAPASATETDDEAPAWNEQVDADAELVGAGA